ncbi:hypothetical protein BDB01DRAFT_901429 [Pilobolus umbonatus]|nr:hypothetical protein BDB01DRAFT_901429 [Pilobolus umbonatus]
MYSESVLSVKDASGRQFSLLNDSNNDNQHYSYRVEPINQPISSRRKYHCTDPGCNKSFTTSGHLARHNRIHTGEKNFHCRHPGCPSRFSRQDNMMQHYRTHLSQKMRRHHHRNKQQKTMKLSESPLYHHQYEPSHYSRRQSNLSFPSSFVHNNMYENDSHFTHRPRRAMSTSSSSSASSISDSSSPPPMYQSYLYPLPFIMNNPSHQPHEQQWHPKSEKSLTSLLNLANIVSTFG